MLWIDKPKWLLAISLLLVLASCGRGGRDLPDVDVTLAIEPEPARLGLATITILLSHAGGQPISGAIVELEGNMNHAGMVPVSSQAWEVSEGQYEADLEFTMGGDWFILVRAALPDGRSLERRVDVPGVDAVCGDTPAP